MHRSSAAACYEAVLGLQLLPFWGGAFLRRAAEVMTRDLHLLVVHLERSNRVQSPIRKYLPQKITA